MAQTQAECRAETEVYLAYALLIQKAFNLIGKLAKEVDSLREELALRERREGDGD